ncbi:hypothetical protein FA13DRAFT_1741671 [Coprinellus micaceus]|uniref:Uncharacterized protein n=1 Tax=Coprinellus micaceus TaxID=71717 RepID=A0A4Y7SJ88_COPMI|nr:hypothetical protein FA13DRAFT_1741671 [Coprinellus micaceus]
MAVYEYWVMPVSFATIRSVSIHSPVGWMFQPRWTSRLGSYINEAKPECRDIREHTGRGGQSRRY